MTELGQMPGDARKRAAGIIDGPDECVGPPPTTVPRLALSVDDLRVGMVVAWYSRDTESWVVYEHDETTTLRDRSTYRDGEPFFAALDAGQVFILSDPPARDWLVPAAQMEALRKALHLDDLWAEGGVNEAARAVLDAAREVEHE